MIELFDTDIREEGRQSSKGNQLKWQKDGVWYKADYTGYEGLAEMIISRLLAKSSLKADEFVSYDTEQISYHGHIFKGCRSRNFLNEGEQLITLERLFQNQFHESLYRAVYQIPEVQKRAEFLVTETEQLTGIADFGTYLGKMLTIDAFFLNEDRHTHNIAVILCDDGSYRLCPLFDHGGSLLSDTTLDYPIEGDVYSMIDQVHAKTLSPDFDEQLDAAEELYGGTLSFSFGKDDVRQILDHEPYYPAEVKKRIGTVIFDSMRRYSYLMK